MTNELNKLGTELSAMMRDYNARKRHLIEVIDKHGVEAGDCIITPDEYDHLFDEATALVSAIEEKLDKALEMAMLKGDQTAVKIVAATSAVLSEHKHFFNHVQAMRNIREKPSTPQ